MKENKGLKLLIASGLIAVVVVFLVNIFKYYTQNKVEGVGEVFALILIGAFLGVIAFKSIYLLVAVVKAYLKK